MNDGTLSTDRDARAPFTPRPTQELPEKSLWVFRKEHPARRLCISLIRNPWFDRVVMTLILLNCVFLAMDSKAPGFEETTRGCASPPAPRANSAPSQRSHFNAKIDSTFT